MNTPVKSLRSSCFTVSMALQLSIMCLALVPFSQVEAQERTFQGLPVYGGADFIGGSAAVDAVAYSASLLATSRRGKDPVKDGVPAFVFDLDARWSPAIFDVRPADVNGIPLLGPSAAGMVEGSLLAYKVGLVFPVGRFIRPFLTLDYFVASHLGSFFQVIDPYYSGNSILSYFSFGIYGLFTGGRETGFSAVAGQILPGIEIEVPGIPITLRSGYLMKFRDPIDESGRFISRFYLEENSWNNVFGKPFGDYKSADDIPPGVEGFDQGQFIFGASVWGIDVSALISGDLSEIGAAELAREFIISSSSPVSTVLKRIRPNLRFVEQGLVQLLGARRFLGGIDGEIRLGSLAFKPVVEASLIPFQLYSAQVDVQILSFLWVGGSMVNKEDGQMLLGWRAGMGFEIPGAMHMNFNVGRNFRDSLVGNLSIHDSLLFNLQIGF